MNFAEMTSLLSGSNSSGGAWLSLAFLLGLVHAFDADHVMALSVFASGKKGAREGAHAGLWWAVGHGLVLLAFGIALLVLGQSLPTRVAIVTERLVSVAIAWSQLGTSDISAPQLVQNS